MARTRKSIEPLNLHKYDVLIEDKGTRSDYFKITQFDGYLYGGRNSLLVAGASVLRPRSKILVEILNKEGRAVFSAPVSTFVEGNSRLIKVEVYSDTPIGPGKIVILGSADTYIDGTPVPDEWKGKYNVRWISDVTISPLVKNKTPIRFETNPSLFVEEKFYAAPSSSQYTETISLPVDVQLSPKYYNVFPNGYLLKIDTSTAPTQFRSEFVGGKITGSIRFTGSSGVELATIDLPITRVYNDSVAESEGKLIYSDQNTLITSAYLSSSGTYVNSVNAEAAQSVDCSASIIYSKLDVRETGSGISFVEARVVDLETISGEINRVRLSFKRSTDPGEYVLLSDIDTGVRELFAADSGSTVVNTGDFSRVVLNDYWYAATMSVTPNEINPTVPSYYYSSSLQPSQTLIRKNDTDIIDAISATPPIVSASFIDNKSYFVGTRSDNFATLFPRSEYTLSFDAFASIVTGSTTLAQNNYDLEVYLVSQENADSRLLVTNPLGQLLGKLTPSSTFKKQNFENIQFNFVPKIPNSGNYGLRFVIYGGHWSISNVSVKPSEEPFFSPDEINVLVPLQNNELDILTFKAEFLDVNNNSSGTYAYSIPTYFTGSSDYVKKIGDYMTGELYIKGLPIQQQALQDAFTGLVSGGLITVNSPASWSYSISSGSGYIVDNYTDPLNPTYTYVTWPPITKTPDAFATVGSVASYPRTNIAINSSGQVVEQSAEFNPEDYRQYIVLGRLAHVNTTYIQRTVSFPLTTYNRGFHWFDLANAVGVITVTGNVYYPSGSGMQIGKTAGQTYRVGSNYKNDTTYPDITTDPASVPTTFAYRYRSGSVFTEQAATTFITGSLYDDGSGTLQTVTPNKFTVQRIYYFGATNTTRIQFGQNIYNTMAEAESSADAETFVTDPNLERDSALRAYLVVGSSATDLSSATDAKFIPVGKFSSTSGGGSTGATKLTDLSDVSISSPAENDVLIYSGSSWYNKPIFPYTGSAVISGSFEIIGPTRIRAISEHLMVTSSAPPAVVNFDAKQTAIMFYSGSATANWTLNFRGDSTTTLNSMLPVSGSITLTLLTRTNATPYSSSVYQIDGNSVTPRWQNGVPGSGNANSLDAHAFTIIKVDNTPTYIVLGSITQYT